MRFSALGPITIDGVAPGAPQVRRLLAELLVHANRPVAQDVLIDALWDGSPPPAAVSAFQSKVSRLRRLLAPDELRSTPAGYLLHLDPADFDVTKFEQLTTTGTTPDEVVRSCRKALDLWRGAAFESAASDRLVEPAAQRLELMRLQTMQREVDALMTLGDLERAILRVQQLIVLDEFAEAPRAALVRCLAGSGRKVEALRAYDEYRRFLAEETGLSPSPGLHALELAVLDDAIEFRPSEREAAATATARTMQRPRREWRGRISTSGTMVGRNPLQHSLRDWLRGAREGSAASVAIIGEAGTGKSLTLQQLLRECRRVGATARIVRSTSVTQPLFLGFDDGTESALLPAEMSTTSLLLLAHRYAHQIVESARRRGLSVVAFDDLHLADAGTVEVAAALVDSIASSTEKTPLIVVLTARPPTPGSELDRLLERMAREPSHSHWVLHPLSEPALHALVRSRTGLDPTPALTGSLRRASRGNPFTALALLAALLERGALELTADDRLHATASDIAAAPASLTSLFDQRIRTLSTSARQLLSLSCVLDRPLITLGHLSGHTDDELHASAAEIATALDLDLSADGWRRVHDLTRSALVASLTTEELATAHRIALRELHTSATSDASVAAQYVAHAMIVGELANPAVVSAAERAGHAAMATMRWADAAEHFELVARHRDDLAGHLDAGLAHFRNHDPVGCRSHLTVAARLGSERGDVRSEATALLIAQRCELNLASDASRFQPSLLIDRADRWRDSAPDLAAEALALAAEGAFHTGDHTSGLALADRARRLAADPEHLAARTAVSFAAGLCRLGALDLRGATADFEQARLLAEENDDGWRLAWALGRLALTWLHRGDPAEALRWCERARSIERPTNNWSELAVTETIAASAHAASGNDDAALDAADEAIALTGRSSYLWTRVPALTVQLLCACRREDAEHARAVLTDIAAVGGPGVARPWVQLVNHRLDAVPPPTEPWVAPAVVHTDTRDIRLLTVASLWAQLQRDRGSSEPVPLLTAAARAGVRCTFGWPFEVRLLTAGQT